MIASDFRAEAREKLAGKWAKAVGIGAAYMAVVFAIGFIAGLLHLENIASIINLVIEVPLSFGIVVAYLKLFNGEEVGAFDFFTLGFGNFGKAWGVTFRIILKMIVPVILLMVSAVIMGAGIAGIAAAGIMAIGSSSSVGASAGIFGIMMFIGLILYLVSLVWMIIKGYYYQLAMMVAEENPEMTAKEAVQKSEDLMRNKRAKLFCLQFSFIGWIILSIFTLGIGMLWVLPYMQFATISFYKNTLTQKETDVVEE